MARGNSKRKRDGREVVSRAFFVTGRAVLCVRQSEWVAGPFELAQCVHLDTLRLLILRGWRWPQPVEPNAKKAKGKDKGKAPAVR